MPKTINPVFALVYLGLLLLLVLSLLLYGHPDEAIKALLIGAVTALLAKVQTIFDFFFGSSQGSKDKDAALNKGPTP
jgi:hypothetical protein